MGSPIPLSTGGGYVLFNSHSPLAGGSQLLFPEAVRCSRRWRSLGVGTFWSGAVKLSVL